MIIKNFLRFKISKNKLIPQPGGLPGGIRSQYAKRGSQYNALHGCAEWHNPEHKKLNIEFKQFLKNYKYEKLLNNYKEFNRLPYDFNYAPHIGSHVSWGHAPPVCETNHSNFWDKRCQRFQEDTLSNPDFAYASPVLGCAIDTTQNHGVPGPSASASALHDCPSVKLPSNHNFYKNYVYGFKKLTKEKQQKLKLETGFSNQSIFYTLAQAKLLNKSSIRTSGAWVLSPTTFAASKGVGFAPHTGGVCPQDKTKTKVLDQGVNTLKSPLLYLALYNKMLPNNLIHPRHLRAFFNKPYNTPGGISNFWDALHCFTGGKTNKSLNFMSNILGADAPRKYYPQYALCNQKDKKLGLFPYSGSTPKYGQHNLITNFSISPKPTYCFLQIILEKYLETPNNRVNGVIINKLPSSINTSVHLNFSHAALTGGKCPQIAYLASMQTQSPLKFPNKIKPYDAPVCFSNQPNNDWSTPNYAFQNLAKQQQSITTQNHLQEATLGFCPTTFGTQVVGAESQAYSLKLFKNISNKTILTYWLIPIAGFAFISGNITMLSRSFNNSAGGVCSQVEIYERPTYTAVDSSLQLRATSSPIRILSNGCHMLGFCPQGKTNKVWGFCRAESQTLVSSKKQAIFDHTGGICPPEAASSDAAWQFLSQKLLSSITTQNYTIASNKLPKPYFAYASRTEGHALDSAPCLLFHKRQKQNPSGALQLLSQKTWRSNFWNASHCFTRGKTNKSCQGLQVSPLYSNQIVKNNLNFIKKQSIISHNPKRESLKLLKSKLITLDKATNSKKTWLTLPTYACHNAKASLQTLEVLSDNQFYTPLTSYNQGLKNVCQLCVELCHSAQPCKASYWGWMPPGFKNSACSVADFKSRFKTAIEINIPQLLRSKSCGTQKPYYILISKLTNLMPNFINNLETLPITTFGFAIFDQNHLQAKAAKTKHLHYIDNKTKLLSNYFENYCQFTRFEPESALAVEQNHTKHDTLPFLSKKQKPLQNELSSIVDDKRSLGFGILGAYAPRTESKNILSKPLKLKLHLMQVLPNAAMQNSLASSPLYVSRLQNTAHNSAHAAEHKKVKLVKKGSSYFLKELLLKKQIKSRANPFLNLFCKTSYAARTLPQLLSQKLWEEATLGFCTAESQASLSVLLSQEKMFKKNSYAARTGTERPQESINTHRLKKLSIQKKRKAKKQRLETRRQKKRIRFFPRPVWLRYRMFLNHINKRLKHFLIHQDTLVYSMQSMNNNVIGRIKHDNKLVKLPLIKSNKSNKFRDSYTAQKSRKNSKTQLTKLVSLFNFKTESTLQFVKYPGGSRLIIKPYLKTKNFNISNQKIKANYSNFNNEKKNNSPPTNNLKTNNQNTVFRDFWISAYNNSLTKSYIPLNWFLPTKPSNQNKQMVLPFSETNNSLSHNFWDKSWANNSFMILGADAPRFVKSIKNAYNKSRNALRINWALNKTNTNYITPYNKRYLLWGTQKLRNQSKNNKTKFFEKQFITNWDYFFLNKKLSNFYKKINNKLIHTNQKLAYITNSSFNVASWGHTSPVREAWSPACDTWQILGLCPGGIGSQYAQHNMAQPSKNPSAPTTFGTKVVGETNHASHAGGVDPQVWDSAKQNPQTSGTHINNQVPHDLFKTPKTQSLVFKIKDIKFFNAEHSAYDALTVLSPTTFVPKVVGSKTHLPNIVNWQNQTNLPSLKYFLTTKKISALNHIEQPGYFSIQYAHGFASVPHTGDVCPQEAKQTQFGDSYALHKFHNYLIFGSCIFLHLCALISLVTISQVRCFSKFHIILLYKLSNFYNSLIQKISNVIDIKKVRLSSAKLPLKQFEHVSTLNSNLEANTGFASASHFKNDYLDTLVSSMQSMKATQILSFSLYLLKKEHKKIFKSNISSNVVISNFKNCNSIRLWPKRNLIAKPTPGPALDSASQNPSVASWGHPSPVGETWPPVRAAWYKLSAKNKNTNLPGYFSIQYAAHKKHKMLLTKVNLVSRKSIFLKSAFSLGWTLRLLLKTGMLSGGIHPQHAEHSTMQKQLSKLNDNNLLQKQNRIYHINQKIFNFNKNKIFLVKFVKEKTAFISFNLINMFQKSVRAVSSFFEKPAEFTTTWIAFGFLIEWSSDLINVIPENIDIFIWDSFYKLTRVIPIQFLFYFNSGTMLLLLNKYGLNTTTIFDPLNKLTQNSLLLKTSNILISHLFYRRILHLIDAFIETISQPDTDLISRQEKGTLFWDLWADFLVTAADYYNVNIAALSTIKAEQNLLIKKISNNFDIDFPGGIGFFKAESHLHRFTPTTFVPKVVGGKTNNSLYAKRGQNKRSFNEHIIARNDTLVDNYTLVYNENCSQFSNLDKIINSCLVGPGSTVQKLSSMHAVKSKGFFVSSNDRWSINQFVTYQSCKNLNTSNGDLFIDFHSPKAFAHIPTIKYNKILQQPIGMLVCQIYSGIFSKQISKNLLLVNMANSLEPSNDYNIQLIQALAGETELKIIRDNAQRYALVNRGFAIGIKLLKDVFFAIALNTPCIFLLEDIHAIGERRPMLLSEYGSSPGSNLSNAERDEVHEKNQVVYQLTRHAIAHYKKPFKGDYSLAIPTNLYSLDLFLKQPSQSTSNLSLIVNHNLTIKNKIKIRSKNNKKAPVQTIHHSLTKNFKTKKANSTYLTPPSTSPFSVLLLKEEKKLKQNKIVEEIAWTGVSVSSLGLQDFQRDSGKHDETKPRTSYSIRAKVSMLAELSLSNISAKLDMITDLLVIIDSVRSNKGFVVFATTNMPHVLDPALRRPGRFDETICLPNINTSSISYFTRNYELIKSVSEALPVQPFFLNCNFNKNSLGAVNLPLVNQKQFLNLTVNYKDYNTILRIKTHHNPSADALTLNNALISYSKKIKQKTKKPYFDAVHGFGFMHMVLPTEQNKQGLGILPSRIPNFGFIQSMNLKLLYCKAIAYHEVGKIMLQYYLTSFFTKYFSDQTQLNLKNINYLSLYGLKNKFLLQLMLLFGGKVALLLSQKRKLISNNIILNNKKNSRDQVFSLVNKPFNLYTKKILDSEIFENNDNLKLATSLMLFFIHKRYLYLKNLIVPQLLSFTEGTLFEEPAGPPFSNLLIPAKRFENYKRLFRDSFIGDNMGQRTSQIPLIEKQQYHTQVNKIKLLNNKQDKITQNLLENGYNNMSNYGQTPTTINWYYQNLLLKRHGQYLTNQWFNGQLSEHNTETVFLSDIDWRSSFIKQKQNNVRQLKNVYTLLKQKKGYSDTNFLRKSNSLSKFQDLNQNGLDILLDFPDTDQYYNPRRRRWLLNKGYWSFWFNLDKVYSEDIIKTWLLESIIQTYTYLYNNTELLDFITSKFIILGYPNYTNFNLNQKLNLTLNSNFELSTLKEIIVTNSFKRF